MDCVIVVVVAVVAVAAAAMWGRCCVALSIRDSLLFPQGKATGAAGSSTNTTLNLPDAEDITSKYVKSVTVASTSNTVGTVTVVMQGTGEATVDTKSIIYTMTCVTGAQCSWGVTGGTGFGTKYLPKV